MKNLSKILFVLVLVSSQIGIVHAGNSEMKPQCRPADVGSQAGGAVGATAGAAGGAALGTTIAANGCVLTGWWTLGIGCAASVVTGVVVGAVVGAKIGEEAGELVCDEK